MGSISFLLLGASAIPLIVAFSGYLSNSTSPTLLVALAVIGFGTTALQVVVLGLRLPRSGQLGALVFAVGMLFWFYGPALTTSLTTDQWDQAAALIRSNNAHAVTAFFAISLFSFVFFLAYMWSPPAQVRLLALRFLGNNVRLRTSSMLLFWLTLLALVAIALYAYLSGGLAQAIQYALLSRSGEKPWSAQGLYGTETTPFHYLAQASLVAVGMVGLTLVLLRRFLGWHRWTALCLVVGCAWWVAIDSGTRSTLLMCVLPPLLVFVAQPTLGGIRRFSPIKLIVLALFGLILIAGTEAQRAYRTFGELDEEVQLRVDDNDFFSLTTFAVAIQETEDRYVGGSLAAGIASGFVPRSLWRDKPVTPTIVIFSKYVWGIDITKTGGNTLPSVVGQAYLMSGVRSVAKIALVFGLVAAIGDALFRDASLSARLAYSALVTYGFLSFRIVGFGFLIPVVVLLGCLFFARWQFRSEVRAPLVPSLG